MEREWTPADWAHIGDVDTDRGEMHVSRRTDGAIVLYPPAGRPVGMEVAARDKLRELLDRAAMPGQPQPCAYCEDDPDHPDPDNPGTCTCQAGGCGRGHCPRRDAAAELGMPGQPPATCGECDGGLIEISGLIAGGCNCGDGAYGHEPLCGTEPCPNGCWWKLHPGAPGQPLTAAAVSPGFAEMIGQLDGAAQEADGDE